MPSSDVVERYLFGQGKGGFVEQNRHIVYSDELEDTSNKIYSETMDEVEETYLSKEDASDTYLSKEDASDTYLSKTDASDTYLSKTGFSNKIRIGEETFESIAAGSYGDALVTLSPAMDNTPNIIAMRSGAGTVRYDMQLAIVNQSTSQFRLRCWNNGTSAITPKVAWIAVCS